MRISSFAVSPEIVPAPEFHRSVASLISSQGRITFGRSLNFQGACGFQQNKKHRTNSNGHSYPTSNRLSVRCLGSIILRLSPHTRLRKWVLSSRNTNMLVFAVCCSFERYVHSTSYGARKIFSLLRSCSACTILSRFIKLWALV